MNTDQQKDYFSPGLELNNLISDQIGQLKHSCQQVRSVQVELWIEDMSGIREKFCKISIQLANNDFCVTKYGSTHSLAIRDAIRTIRQRISRIKARNEL